MGMEGSDENPGILVEIERPNDDKAANWCILLRQTSFMKIKTGE
jgi:hypothetical protein